MKINYKLNPNKTYIVGVSFGPDSMCLLDLLNKEKCTLVVGHVNYHRRPESNSEQDRLGNYCKTNNIKLEVLDTDGLTPKGNFQKWAREIRYEFFANLEKKYNAECVFVAHQQDDLIETYLMQKNKNNFVKYWGIAEKNTVKHAHIVRPLLSYTKAQLQNYCDKNNVPYAIDSSNLEDHYARNKIRHFVVEKMTAEDREKIIKEIINKNQNIIQKSNTNMSVEKFLNLRYEDVILFISNYLNQNGKHLDLSKNFVNEIKEAFKSTKPNIAIHLIDGFSLLKEYDEVFLINKKEKINYSYLVYRDTRISDKYFEVDLNNYFEERNITNDMFPVTIKPISKNEDYRIDKYTCKIRRLFIDWKVPPHLRECWPGIYDKNGHLIYVPRYKKEFIDKHKSVFVIKFTNK